MDIDSWPLQNSVTTYGRISNTRRQVQIENDRGDRTGEIGEQGVRSSTIQRVRFLFYYPHVITIWKNIEFWQFRRVGPYDIALMKVERPFELNLFVSTVSLPYPDTIPVGDAMLTGWGSIGRSQAHESPENLQAAILPIINYQLCNKIITKSLKPKEKNPLHPTNVCTGPLDGSLAACKV